MVDKGDSRLNDIKIPEGVQSEFHKVLSTIHEQEDLAKALEKCNVHTSPDLAIDHLILVIKKNEPWAAGLKNGGSRTGTREIDSMIDKYGINLSLVNWDDEHNAVVINSEKPLNISALANDIRRKVNVVKVVENSPKNRGNDIQVKQTQSGWLVTYIYRFGSQFGNANKEHHWRFECSKNYEVKFIEESGDELPTWSPCKLKATTSQR